MLNEPSPASATSPHIIRVLPQMWMDGASSPTSFMASASSFRFHRPLSPQPAPRLSYQGKKEIGVLHAYQFGAVIRNSYIARNSVERLPILGD
jgi:hypothetical protein